MAVDVRRTRAHPVLKSAVAIMTVFTGPFEAFFYVLGCREPLPRTHEQYVATRWRQVLGSAMHCAAGDGLGIIAGAAIATRWSLPRGADLSLEYALGFGFGWAFFQAFAMREMAGSYSRALRMTFFPEFVSMNFLMAGMVLTMRVLMHRLPAASDPLVPSFWFVMSMALIAGFVLAYPINWWLVAYGLKHGMITVRDRRAERGLRAGDESHAQPRAIHPDNMRPASNAHLRIEAPTVAALSIVVLAAAIVFG